MMKGAVAVGYRLFNEVFYGKQLKLDSIVKSNTVINDYSALFRKGAEFLYFPIDKVEAIAFRRQNFIESMSTRVGRCLSKEIATNYKYYIQEPLHVHRKETSDKYTTRNDYISMDAYGMGKVKVDQDKT